MMAPLLPILLKTYCGERAPKKKTIFLSKLFKKLHKNGFVHLIVFKTLPAAQSFFFVQIGSFIVFCDRLERSLKFPKSF